MYLRIIDGAIAFPYQPEQLRYDEPNVSFPKLITAADLTPWGVWPVQVAPKPVYDKLSQVVHQLPPEQVEGQWSVTWQVTDLPPEQVAQNAQKAQDDLLAGYTAAMDDFFDSEARKRRYDNRITASLRAGYPGPFQAQGLAFATWMDGCNALGYQIMDEVLSGQRALPTVEEFMAMLPPMVWPA